jgi:hypothetical protein
MVLLKIVGIELITIRTNPLIHRTALKGALFPVTDFSPGPYQFQGFHKDITQDGILAGG